MPPNDPIQSVPPSPPVEPKAEPTGVDLLFESRDNSWDTVEANPPEGPGRPTKYNRNNVYRLLKYISFGCNKAEASSLIGIVYDTMNAWENEYSDFSVAVKKAELEQKASLVLEIRRAGREHWQANAWLLERRYPDEFSLHHRIETRGKTLYEFPVEDINKLMSEIVESEKAANQPTVS